MELTEDTVDGVRVCRLAGPLDLAAADELRSGLHKIVRDGAKMVVLDLAGAGFVCSSAFTALISFRQALARTGGKVVLCGLSTAIHKLFKISRLDEVFEIVTSEADAIAAVRA